MVRKVFNLKSTKLPQPVHTFLEAVRLNKRTKEACEDEIIGETKKWLVKAKTRADRQRMKSHSGNFEV